MKAHIEKIHTGFGEPFQNDTGKYVYAQERITDSLSESISSYSPFHRVNITGSELFDRSNRKEAIIASAFEQITLQYIKLEQLLQSNDYDEKDIQKILGDITFVSVISRNPSRIFNDYVRAYTDELTLLPMLKNISIAKNMTIISILEMIEKCKGI